jgi:NhaP-type Na+/H+ or K+/H+ antiporter
VVLFNTFSKFVGYSHGTGTVLIAIADFVVIFSGSLLIGYLVGCLAGLCSKHTKFEHHHMVEMTAYMLLM